MRKLEQPKPYFRLVTIVVTASCCVIPQLAFAERAAMVFDLNSGQVHHAENALALSYPASLTKLMSLYLVFDAIEQGRLSLQTELTVSPHAAAQLPVKLGLSAGTTITVEQAIPAVIISSANDIAVVLAEAVAGTHESFVHAMNAKARLLGLARTQFRNASGLPHPEQVTTARDIGLLVRALHHNHRKYYGLFAETSYRYKGREIKTHNSFVTSFRGARGLKTGFTCRAGYNLAASAERDGRHLVGIVLGSKSALGRDSRIQQLMTAAFRDSPTKVASIEDLAPREQGAGLAKNNRILATDCLESTPSAPREADHTIVQGWSIDLGVEVRKEDALRSANYFIDQFSDLLRGGRPLLTPRWVDRVIYEVAVTDLKEVNAVNTCLSVRSLVVYCVVRSPAAAQYAMDQAKRVLRAVAERDRLKPQSAE